MSRRRALSLTLCWCAVGWALPAAADDDASDDDDVIIIEDEASSDDDDVIIIDDGTGTGDDDTLIIEGDDDEIIILDDESPTPELPAVSGALGRLWEALYVSVAAEGQFYGQWTAIEDGPLRVLGSSGFESWLLPTQNLSLYARGFARLAFDGAPENFRFVPVVDLYESYAKINAEVGSVQLGRLVAPWGGTRVAALGDRLNPPDHRRSVITFPDAVQNRQPQWGALLKTSLGSVVLEGVLFTLYEPTEGSLAASNQAGVRAARYQTALVRSPARAGGLFAYDTRENLYQNLSLLDSTTLAVRARRRVGELKIGGSAVIGLDEVPTLQFSPAMARYLGDSALGKPVAAPPCNPGDVASNADCFGRNTLRHNRSASLAADVEWGFGIVTLKAEAMINPRMGFVPGKTALVIDDAEGLKSVQVSQYGGAVAMETGYGEWFEGSVELFGLGWVGVPTGSVLWGVEALSGPLPYSRIIPGFVPRAGLGVSVGGSVFDQALTWRLRGEAGLVPIDILMSGEVRYQLPILKLYVGTRGNIFAGLPGSPGWMRQDASMIGLFMGWGTD